MEIRRKEEKDKIKEVAMANGQIVYTNSNLTDQDGEELLGQHTSALYVINNDGSGWVELRLNGGPHSVWVPPVGDSPSYTCVPGDHPRIQVMTPDGSLRVFAIG
jgi:hypothetical protein